MGKNIEVKIKYVAPSIGYFEIDNRNSVYRLVEKMAPSMTQGKLAEFSRESKEKGNPYAVGIPKFLEICEDAIKSKNADLLNHICSGLKNYPQFLSRGIYSPVDSENGVIHEYGLFEEYFKQGNLVGDDGWINKINNKNALELFTGIKDVEKLNKISNAINKTPMYLWRFNLKPPKKIESVIRFDAFDYRLGLCAGWPLSGENPAFLVQKVK